MAKITGLKRQVSRRSRYSIYIDGRYAFGLSDEAVLASKLVVGETLDKTRLAELKQLATSDAAYSALLRFVTIRPRSEGEVFNYCKRKYIDEAVAADCIARLRALGLINDVQFAHSWVASRRALKPTSRRRLQQELRQKQVDSTIIDTVLAEDKTDERQVLVELIERKRRIPRYKDDLKLLQYLSRQGYDYEMIKSALNSVEPLG